MNQENIPALLEYQMAPAVRAFSTKRTADGPLDGPYAGFNITHYCGDAPDHVAASRHSLCQLLGIADNHLFLPHQTHGTELVEIDNAFLQLPVAEQQQQLYAKDITKGSGILHALESLGIPVAESFAFGDGVNDIEMMQTVGLSIAMGNAQPQVKEIASETVPSVDDDGVAWGIEHLILKGEA